MINLGKYQDRVLTIVKGKYGLKNKSDAVNFIIEKFEKDHLEPELKPEFIEHMKNLEKNAKWVSYNSFEDFKKDMENDEI